MPPIISTRPQAHIEPTRFFANFQRNSSLFAAKSDRRDKPVNFWTGCPGHTFKLRRSFWNVNKACLQSPLQSRRVASPIKLTNLSIFGKARLSNPPMIRSGQQISSLFFTTTKSDQTDKRISNLGDMGHDVVTLSRRKISLSSH